MRLQGVAKLGYYPTPTETLKRTAKLLRPEKKGPMRLYDPCAGEGTALQFIAKILKDQGAEPATYAIELSDVRAEKATEVLDTVIQADYQDVTVSYDSMSILYLNPPYHFGAADDKGKHKRLEYEFLKKSIKQLQDGGLLIYIIPLAIMANKRVSGFLTKHFENIQEFRLPGDEYETFKQVIIFGKKRAEIIKDDETKERLESYTNGGVISKTIDGKLLEEKIEAVLPPELPNEADFAYTVPRQRELSKFTFRKSTPDPEEVVNLVINHGAHSTKEWKHISTLRDDKGFQPLVPLKKGHIASLMSTGQMGVVNLRNEVLATGRTIKMVEHKKVPVEGKVGPYGQQKYNDVETDVFMTRVTTITPEGKIKQMMQPGPLGEFLDEYGEEIAQIILKRYAPVYKGEMTAEEQAHLDTIMKSEKRKLKGRETTGLFAAQKHTIAAARRSLSKEKAVNIIGEMGSGKAQPLSTPIPTPYGWTTMGDLKPGDVVFSRSGNPTIVEATFPQGIRNVYTIHFSDGSSTEIDEGHLWSVNTATRIFRGYPFFTKTTKELVNEELRYSHGGYKYRIPMTEPVRYCKKHLPIHPYLLGTLIGDGSLSTGSIGISTGDSEMITTLSKMVPDGITIHHDNGPDYRISIPRNSGKNPLMESLRKLGLYGTKSETKFIPSTYHSASVSQRTELLQGLLDTDGHDTKRGAIEFVTVSQQLSVDMRYLVESLGGTAKISTKTPTYEYDGKRHVGQLAYRVYINLPPEIVPFKLRRKLETWAASGTSYRCWPHRMITRIEYKGQEETKCIKVSNDEHLYLTDKHYIVTHNTAMSAALMDLIGSLDGEWDNGPCLVMCPGHLTRKWKSEVEVAIPGGKGVIIENLEDLYKQTHKWKPGLKWYFIISKDRAKLGSRWVPAWNTRRKKVQMVAPDRTVKESTAYAITCPKCGRMVRDEDGDIMYDPFLGCEDPYIAQNLNYARKTVKLYCGEPSPKWIGDPYDNTTGKEELLDGDGKIRTCGEPLWRIDAYRWFDSDTVKGSKPNVLGLEREDAEPGVRRWPVGDIIKSHFNGFFRMVIADEVHDYKAKGSAQGLIYHALVDSAPYVVNLTGTIFNGMSTSLFYLLYRTLSEIRDGYEYNGESQWAKEYGRLRRVVPADSVDTAYGRRRKHRSSAKEIPGISPAVFSHLLPNTIFLRVADLGWKLPTCHEFIERIDMGEEQEAQYKWMENTLRTFISEARGSQSSAKSKAAQRLLSVWLQRSLGRANAGFRRETVIWKAYDGKEVDDELHEPFPVTKLPVFGQDDEFDTKLEKDPDLPEGNMKDDEYFKKWVTQWEGSYAPMALDRVVEEGCILPKEQRMIEICEEATEKRDKVLIYCRQTATRDIQPRLARLLSTAGINVEILPKNVQAKNRDKWIKDHAEDFDVMICNPETVKTGLDLVQFNRIIYYEMTYNLTTLWQSVKRIYRLGQTKETYIYYLVYGETMEEQALALMGQKLKASNTLYGDSADSAIAEEVSDGNILQELAERQLEGEKFTVDGMSSLLAVEEQANDTNFTEEQAVVYDESNSTDLDADDIINDIEDMLGLEHSTSETDDVEEETFIPSDGEVVEIDEGNENSFFDINIDELWDEWKKNQEQRAAESKAEKKGKKNDIGSNGPSSSGQLTLF